MKGPLTVDDQKRTKPGAKRNGYRRIFELGADKVAVLNSYLITDTFSIERIIEIVQGDWGDWQGIPPEALRRQLFRYKSDFIVPQQAKIATKLTSDGNVAKLAAATTAIEQSIDVLKEMEWAVSIQLLRVKKMRETEAGLPMPLDVTTKNLQLLTDQLGKLAALQMDVGVLRKVPTKVQHSVDLTEEEMRFTAEAKVFQAEVGTFAQAVAYLKEQGVLRLPAAEQEVEVAPGGADFDDDGEGEGEDAVPDPP